MAEKVLKNVSLTLGGSANLGPYIKQVGTSYSAEVIDKTTMGTAASPRKSKSRRCGLLDFSFTVEWKQDFANLLSVIWPLVGADAFAFVLKGEDASKDADNPEFTGNCILPNLDGPVKGSVGELATMGTTFEADGDVTMSIA